MKTVRELDGEPHEVAAEVGRRASDALASALKALDDFEWAAKGAYKSAEYERTGGEQMPTDEDFYAAPLGRQIKANRSLIEQAVEQQRKLTAAAAWNPRASLTGD